MTGWAITPTAGGLRLHRPGRARMDFVATATIQHTRPTRLAHQIRQDLWRKLQKLKGFSPVIEIEGQRVKAGGQVDGPIPPSAIETTQSLLNCPIHRSRWERNA